MDKKELIVAILCFAVGAAVMVFLGNSVSPKIGNLLASYDAPPATPEMKQAPAQEPGADNKAASEKSETVAQSEVTEKEKAPEPAPDSGKASEEKPKAPVQDVSRTPAVSAPAIPIENAPEKADTGDEIKPKDTKQDAENAPTETSAETPEAEQPADETPSSDAETAPADQDEKPSEIARDEVPSSADEKQAEAQTDQPAETAADAPSFADEKQADTQPAETPAAESSSSDDETQADADEPAPAETAKETAETPSQADTPAIKSPEEVKKLTAALKNGESLDLGDGRIAYKVKGGDTFSQICRNVLGTSSTWQKEAEKMGIDYRKLSLGQVLIFEK